MPYKNKKLFEYQILMRRVSARSDLFVPRAGVFQQRQRVLGSVGRATVYKTTSSWQKSVCATATAYLVNFTKWSAPDACRLVFERLLRDLKV